MILKIIIFAVTAFLSYTLTILSLIYLQNRGTEFEVLFETMSMDEETTFPFTYQDENYEARLQALPSNTGFRNFKIHFPNVLNIVEGSVEISESLYGEWEICKIFSADPIQEEFLHCLAQNFVEYIDTHQNASL